MKNRKIYSFVLIISFLIASKPLFSQVYDVFTNETLEMISGFKWKKINPVNSVFKQEIEINYFEIAPATTAALKSINSQAYDLCHEYITNETKSQGLIDEINQRLKVKAELQNSINHRRGWRNSNAAETPYKLSEIRSNIISMVAGNIFIELRFTFAQRSRSRYSRDDKIEISHYYIANINDGKIKRLKNNLSKTANEKIKKKISKKLNDSYDQINPKRKLSELELIRSNRKYYGDEDEEELDSAKITEDYKDVCVRIDLSEADFFWFGWGLMLRFQSYTNSSKIYYGNSFQVFFPLKEAKKILGSMPNFSFIKELSQPKTNLHDFNDIQLNNTIFDYQREPSIENLLKINPLNKIPKKLVIKDSTIMRNQRNYYSGKTEIKFNSKGWILSKIFYEENDKLSQSNFYTYDSKGNVTSQITENIYGDNTYITNKFDRHFNLIETIYTHGDNSAKTLNFYNENYIYSFQVNRNLEYFSRMQYDDTKFCKMKNSCYLFDKQGNIIAYKSSISNRGVGQYGRDSLGRIVETHFENDEENFYWNYDSLNRISSFQSYGSRRPKYEVQYFYQGNSALPYKKIKKDFANRSTYESVYYWE